MLQNLKNKWWLKACFVQASLLFFIFSVCFNLPICIYLLIWRFNIWTVSLIGGYAIWVLFYDFDTCEKGSLRYRSRWLRGAWFLNLQAKYFPITLTKAENFEMDPKKNYLFCGMPHGVFSIGIFFSFATDALKCYDLFPQMKNFSMCGFPSTFKIPFLREAAMLLGICSVSKESLNYLLSDPNGGNAPVVEIGGHRELLYSYPNTYRLDIRKRTGFIKIALKNGAPLVPVFSFGETDLFKVYPNKIESLFRSVQLFVLKYTNLPLFLFFGYGILPFDIPVNVVVGAPIEVPMIKEPTREEINHYHELFVKKTHELFESQKHKYLKNAKEVKLELL